MEWRILLASIFIMLLCKWMDAFVDMSFRGDLINQLFSRISFVTFVIDVLFIICTFSFM